MKISELECPSCGGKLTIDEKNPSIAVCEYCNSRYALEWDDKAQASFKGSATYTDFKAPEGAGGARQGENGKKAVLIGGCLLAFLMILMIAGQLRPGGGLGAERADVPDIKIKSEYLPERRTGKEEEAETDNSSDAPQGALGEMASLAFGMPADKISKEDLSKIQWIEMKSDIECLQAGYSFEDPNKEGAALTWISLPRETDPGKDSLRLFTGLKKLNVNYFIDKEDLEGLQLESVGGYFGSPLEVAGMVENPELIKEIYFGAGADSLEGLENFPNLEALYTDYCELEDIKPVAQVPGLKKLTFEGLPELNDFSVLSTLSNLEELYLEAENLKTLDFLKGMKKLKSLKIADGQILSLDELANVPELTSLTVEGCDELKSMEAVSGLGNLRELALELPYDCAEPAFGGMEQLEKLSLTYFDDCNFVGNMTGLTELTLESCTISPEVDLSGLTELKSLTCHAFVSTGKDLSFAAGFPALEKLDLQGMSTYDDISWAFNSASIKELNISGMECEIAFDAIGENRTLERLSMDGVILYNNVQISGGDGIMYVDWDDVELTEHLDFFKKLKGLKSLSIAENELTDIEFAKDLTVLETLDIKDNYVTDLKPLAGLKLLRSVNCGGNPIANDRVLDDKVVIIRE